MPYLDLSTELDDADYSVRDEEPPPDVSASVAALPCHCASLFVAVAVAVVVFAGWLIRCELK